MAGVSVSAPPGAPPTTLRGLPTPRKWEGVSVSQGDPGGAPPPRPPNAPTICAHPTPPQPSCDPPPWSATSVCGSAGIKPQQPTQMRRPPTILTEHPDQPGRSILSSGGN